MKLILFAGQGSQFKSMGKSLFSKFPIETKTASGLLGYDIEDLCINDQHEQLHLTQFTQPALYVVNAFRWWDKSITNADYLMGHSLGEYNALLASGAFDFEMGLKIVQERGRLMGEASGGGMLAVLNLTADALQNYLDNKNIHELDIANYNTATQLVLSGPKDITEKALELFTKDNIRAIPLKVSAAFHSRYMEKAAQQFRDFLKKFVFRELKIPVVANTTARPYDSSKIADTLADQIKSPVLWSESIRYLMAKNKKFEFAELGKNPILSRMVTAIKAKEKPLVLETKEVISPLNSQTIAILPKNEFGLEKLEPLSVSIMPNELGAATFQQRYKIKYSYLTGAMYRGIASKELVVAIGKFGLMGFLGTGGMSIDEIEINIKFIQKQLSNNYAYGMNLLCRLDDPQFEMKTIELYLKYGITNIEAAAFMMMTPALVYFRIKGLEKDINGNINCKHKIIAKISRPEIAEKFLSPPPLRVIEKLLKEKKISIEQAQMASQVAMSFDICVEADSGGHTDQGITTVLLPSIQNLTQKMKKRYKYNNQIHIGLSGGIGTAEAAISAFTLGADFIMTGSINQCTVEAGISDTVKNMLQDINVQDTAYAPAGDMFEIGAKIQVLKRGVFFPNRANKLFMLYKHYDSLEDIPTKIRKELEDKYFKKTFDSIWEETKSYFQSKNDQYNIEKAMRSSKHKMALIFRWYFGYSSRITFDENNSDQVNFQIHTGPALGAFNQWVKGTELESWKNRHVDDIAEKLMQETARIMTKKIVSFCTNFAKREELYQQRIRELEQQNIEMKNNLR